MATIEVERRTLASPEVQIVYDEVNNRYVSTVFEVEARAALLWRHLRMSRHVLRNLSAVTIEETRDLDDGCTSVATIGICVSRTLGLRVGAELEMRFDEATRTMCISTRECRWGTYECTLHLEEVEADAATTRVHYESCFGKLTIAGMRLPFVDAKLQRFTESIVAKLQSSLIKTHWRDELAASFEPLVARPLVDASDLTAATAFADIRGHLERLLPYTMLGGKFYRALLVRLTASVLAPGRFTTPIPTEFLPSVRKLVAVLAGPISTFAISPRRTR
jgi:hypothetical protein